MMEDLELYKTIASEIEEKLGNNHISTILHMEEPTNPDEPTIKK